MMPRPHAVPRIFHVLVCEALLLEHMCLHLIHRWCDLSKLTKIDKTIWIEIADADSAQLARFESFFHGTISAIIIAERLMNEHEIDIIALQIFQRFVNRRRCFFVACVRHPNLCCKEEFSTRQSATSDRFSNSFFIAV